MTDDRKPMANIPPFGLRMQPELKARIEAAAKANNRSMNAEIVARLEEFDRLQEKLEQWAAGNWAFGLREAETEKLAISKQLDDIHRMLAEVAEKIKLPDSD